MSIDYDASRERYRVRWREDGPAAQPAVRDRGRRPRRSTRRSAARRAASRRWSTVRRAAGGGVYAYATADGTRWRFVFRQSDGSLTTRRGFASRRAAATRSRDADRGGPSAARSGAARHVRDVLGAAARGPSGRT